MDVIFNAAQMAGRYTAFVQITVRPFWVKLKTDRFDKEAHKSKLMRLLLRVKLWIIAQAQLSHSVLQWRFSCQDIYCDSAWLRLLFGDWRLSRETAEEHRVGIVTVGWFNGPSMHCQTHSTLSSICLRLWRFSPKRTTIKHSCTGPLNWSCRKQKIG